MINLNGTDFKNWKDYFGKTIAESLKYDRIEERRKNQTEN